MDRKLINVLIGLSMFSLGFGASQLALAKDVHSNTIAMLDLRKEFEKEQTRTDNRIFHLTSLMEKQFDLASKQTEQVTVLIQILKQK